MILLMTKILFDAESILCYFRSTRIELNYIISDQ
jgi:hypothetical protein